MWLAIPEPHPCRKPGHYTDSWRKRKRAASRGPNLISVFSIGSWLRGLDLNQRPLGYEPNELPGCSTPQLQFTNCTHGGQITDRTGHVFNPVHC
jgi:hypothetical protein